MLYRKFPRTNWSVSAVGMGCWALGGQFGAVAEKTALATLERAVELGVNLFDTADGYGVEPGMSEKLVGQGLKKFRDKVFIATKVGNWGRRIGRPYLYETPEDIYTCCDASLARMQTDYIDLYQCHIGALKNPSVFIEGFETLIQKKKIRAYGISTNHFDVLKRFHEGGTCTVCQVEYSLLRRDPEKEILPFCEKNQIGTLIRGPLAQGLLTGKFSRETVFTDEVRDKWNPDGEAHAGFLKQIEKVEIWREKLNSCSMTERSIQFPLLHSAVTTLIPGAKSPAQIEELVKAGISLMSKEDVQLIHDIF
jgi:myo-inositol catabolism protein IolS